MNNIAALKARMKDFHALTSATALMDWDQQTYMPKGGADARAAHVESLSKLAHEMLTDPKTAELVDAAAQEVTPGSDEEAWLRVMRREIGQATKIPSELVARKSRLAVQAHEEWVQARQQNDFRSFAPTLAEMFEICRQEAEHLGYSDHIYDALLDLYEEGATAADCRAMFDSIREPIVSLVKEIAARPEPDDSALYGEWDVDRQRRFTERIVAAIGFDFERGRQDTAPHPFCTGWSVGDIRLTTRYKPYIGSAIFGSLHEAGHGMYEQGSPKEWDIEMAMLRGGVSLGIHESQSRLWENIVGRSKAFWRRYLPELQAEFPQLATFDVDSWYRAINKVKPSLIRVEADELTYNLHVMIRFEIECAVLEGVLDVNDIPSAWNQKYEDYLGVRPPTDSDGCLQDVHWSMGSIGYFPTYTMGNLLSYQIWDTLLQDLPNADDLIESGNFKPIHGWLKQHIYSQGRKYPPKQLIERVTGRPMAAFSYLTGLQAKYREIYGLEMAGASS